MKVISVDISGKVSKYDNALYESLLNNVSDGYEVICLTPYKVFTNSYNYKFQLTSLVPEKFSASSSKLKRIVKAIEGVINYIRLGNLLKKSKAKILHMQWLPFLEISSIEYYFLKWYKNLSPNLKIILTVHNIYPHNSTKSYKELYRKRFARVKSYIDSYIVHTTNSVVDLKSEFGVSEGMVTVIPHGVFEPQKVPQRCREDNRVRLLMFGYQSQYKGTDLLLEAFKLLPHDVRTIVDLHIVGKTAPDLHKQLEEMSPYVRWKNRFVSDEELNEEIVNSDIIIYPYRAISQSGALLLGLFFEKPMILSDLPSFIETLDGYPKELYFKAGNSESLAEVIGLALTRDSTYWTKLKSVLNTNKNNYSWLESANKTYNLYQDIGAC